MSRYSRFGTSGKRGLFSRITLIEVMVVVTIVLLLVAMVISSRVSAEKKRLFMQECIQDHKRYECDLMWRNSEPETTTIIVPSQ